MTSLLCICVLTFNFPRFSKLAFQARFSYQFCPASLALLEASEHLQVNIHIG